jgi:hypothetical protein
MTKPVGHDSYSFTSAKMTWKLVVENYCLTSSDVIADIHLGYSIDRSQPPASCTQSVVPNS